LAAVITTNLSNKNPDISFRKFYGARGPYYMIEYTLCFTVVDGQLESESVYHGDVIGSAYSLDLF
jgi:hypothetical protein